MQTKSKQLNIKRFYILKQVFLDKKFINDEFKILLKW